MAQAVTPETDTAVQPFPGSFWTANVTELFERAAYYSMASFVVIYLGSHERHSFRPGLRVPGADHGYP